MPNVENCIRCYARSIRAISTKTIMSYLRAVTLSVSNSKLRLVTNYTTAPTMAPTISIMPANVMVVLKRLQYADLIADE